MFVPNVGSGDVYSAGEESTDDYCKKGYIIDCPPGAAVNTDCHCIKDPGLDGVAKHPK